MSVLPRINNEYYRLCSINNVMMRSLRGGREVQRLEVLEQDAQRQQRDEGPQPARRSHVVLRLARAVAASSCRASRRSAARIMQPGGRLSRLCRLCRPASRLAGERRALTRPPRRYAHRPRCTFTMPRMQSTHIFASRSDKRIDDESGLWRRMRTNLTANAVSTSRSRLLFSY